MSKKRYIDTNFWNDTWVENLDRDEKYFFLYLLTNEQTSIAGIYEISLRRMSFETGFSATELVQMIQKMDAKMHYIDGWIVLRNAIKLQNYRNDKIKRGIKRILEECPIQLLEFVNIPSDIGIEVNRPEPEPNQTRLIDDLSMTNDDSLHLIKLNIIKYNSNVNETTDGPSGDSNKFERNVKTPAQKRVYAIAMKKEREQKSKAKIARTREPSKVTAISEQAFYDRRTHKS